MKQLGPNHTECWGVPDFRGQFSRLIPNLGFSWSDNSSHCGPWFWQWSQNILPQLSSEMLLFKDTALAILAFETDQRQLGDSWIKLRNSTPSILSPELAFTSLCRRGCIWVIFHKLSVLSKQRPNLLLLLNLSVVFPVQGLSEYCSMTEYGRLPF
jgi:hypothetical protein